MMIACAAHKIISISFNMRTQFFHCDVCKDEIKGSMGVFVFNETLLDKDFKQVPVSKQADLCQECSDVIVKAIDEHAKKVGELLDEQKAT